MVHNGIEYGDMQLICEAYQLMKDALGMTCDEMSEVSGVRSRLYACGNRTIGGIAGGGEGGETGFEVPERKQKWFAVRTKPAT